MANSLLPPEINSYPRQAKRTLSTLGTEKEDLPYGRQLSSLTELKQGKKSGNLFLPTRSALTDTDSDG
jgi:hypothetical protein